jgi:hypothetical protein
LWRKYERGGEDHRHVHRRHRREHRRIGIAGAPDVRRAEGIDPKVRECIRDQLKIADNGKELDALTEMLTSPRSV